MLHYTFTATQPIFSWHDSDSAQIIVPAHNLITLSQHKGLPVPDYALGQAERSPVHGALRQITRLPGDTPQWLAQLCLQHEMHPVEIKASCPYFPAPTRPGQMHRVALLSAPAIRAVKRHIPQPNAPLWHALIATLEQDAVTLFDALRPLSFITTTEGGKVLQLLYGTPPSHCALGDALKYLGDLLGRTLDHLIYHWLHHTAQLSRTDCLPPTRHLSTYEWSSWHKRPRLPEYGETLSLLQHALDMHAHLFLSPASVSQQLLPIIQAHLVRWCDRLLPLFLSEADHDLKRHYVQSTLLSQWRQQIMGEQAVMAHNQHQHAPLSRFPTLPELALGNNLTTH